MILLIIAIIMMIGSTAATDTATNDTITTTDNVAKATTTTTDTQPTTTDTSNTTTKTITKTTTNETVKSKSSTASSTSTVKSSTKTTVNNITTTKNSKVTIKAIVKTTNGANVKSGTVTFKVNGKTIGKSTVSQGTAKLTYKIPSTWKDINYSLTATYTGNNNYAASTSTKSNIKIKTNQATKIKVTNITSAQGEKITLKATITTADGNYVKTGKVAFKINGKTVGTTTVSNGGAKLSYTIPESWKDKQYTISVVYGKNDYYKSATAKGLLKLTDKRNPAITINTTSVYTGQSTIIATITSKAGKSITGGKVVFKLNDKTIGSTTLSGSVAKITYNVPTTLNGKYSLTVLYGGYGKYNSIKKTSTISVVKKVSSKVTITTTSATSNSTVTLTALIKDSSGNSITGGKAAFKINGKTIGKVSVTGGTAQLDYSIPSGWNGNYNITVVYGGHGKYIKSSQTTKLTVYKKGSISVPNGYSSYVKQTTNCQVYNSKIQALAKKLTSGTSSAYTAATKIYNYVRDQLSYTLYYNTRNGAVKTLSKKNGNCVDQTHLLIALMRASNIPSRYCHATCSFRSGLVTGHVWAEVYVNGKWYKCDTTSKSNKFNKIVNWNHSTKVTRYISLPF